MDRRVSYMLSRKSFATAVSVCVSSVKGWARKTFLVAATCTLLSNNVYAGWNLFQLSAPNTASTSGAITAVSRIPNSMEVWWIGGDGSVHDANWYGGGQWNQFVLAPQGSAAIHGGIAAVSRIPNTMEVWWIGGDGSVWDAYWYEGGQWNQFQLAPPGSASPYGGITAVSRMPNTMEVMWIGADGSVWDAYWYDGQQWNRYQLAPPNSASTNGRSITAVSRRPNTMEVWWIGLDGSVQDAYWYEWGPWGKFALAPAGSASVLGGIAAVSRMPNSLEVWWIGLYGSVQDAYWYEGGGPWNQVALAPRGSASMTGRITALSRIPNSMEVWWTGNDDSVQDANLYQGGSWNQFALASPRSTPIQGGIAAVSRISNSMEVWWIGGDGSVWDANWYDSTSFNIKAFADRLQNDLQGKSVGYSFSVSYQDQWIDMRWGGDARTSADSNPLAMSSWVKFSTASMSKTITAAAALQLLEPSGARNMVDDAIGPYLPVEFNADNSFKAITFRQLLQHMSGIPADTGYDVDYSSLKTYVSGHPNVGDKSYHYSNTNYALFRFLIPNLAGIPLQSGDIGMAYAVAYMQYVQQHVFAPVVLGTISAQSDSFTGLDYHFPLPSPPYRGMDLGDLTTKIGSQGWIMSTQDLAHFLRDLNYSENVVSGAVAKQMRDKGMGYDGFGLPAANGSHYAFWGKGGFYPGCGYGNLGEFHGNLMVFSNDVSVAVIVNSNLAYNPTADACNYQDNDPAQAVLDAFNYAIGK